MTVGPHIPFRFLKDSGEFQSIVKWFLTVLLHFNFYLFLTLVFISLSSLTVCVMICVYWCRGSAGSLQHVICPHGDPVGLSDLKYLRLFPSHAADRRCSFVEHTSWKWHICTFGGKRHERPFMTTTNRAYSRTQACTGTHDAETEHADLSVINEPTVHHRHVRGRRERKMAPVEKAVFN